MTLHRRPLGRGRWMAALGGVLMVVGSVLPWWQVGGTPGITANSGKCPRKCGSLMVTAFQPVADSPALISVRRSIIRNGGR